MALALYRRLPKLSGRKQWPLSGPCPGWNPVTRYWATIVHYEQRSRRYSWTGNHYHQKNVSTLAHWNHVNAQPSPRFMCLSRIFHSKGDVENLTDWSEDAEDCSENDEKYEALVREHYILPDDGHQVLIIQPVVRWGPRKPKLTTADHQLAEAMALVRTLPDWKITDSMSVTLKRPSKTKLFAKGQFADLTSKIRSRSEVSAVFLNVSMLTGLQLVTMQQSWGIPVYDRYTIVLQIFKVHAMSNEAKLQVALAEVPYFRSRLLGMHNGMVDNSSLEKIGGTGENYLEARRNILMEREMKIKKTLMKLRGHRQLLRQNRIKKELPIVAVVGYTNSGKTSLIKALTGETGLQPRDQLFATLDVTAHSGKLPSGIKVVYMDTVGFISDIPTDLIEAFTATLEDAMLADVIVHVRDISHPDTESQRVEVVKTLENLTTGHGRSLNFLEVANKCDKVQSMPEEIVTDNKDNCILSISATKGTGLHEFLCRLETEVMETTGLSVKKLRIPANGGHIGWLYKHAVVQDIRADDDGKSLLIQCVISRTNIEKFRAEFGKKNRR